MKRKNRNLRKIEEKRVLTEEEEFSPELIEMIDKGVEDALAGRYEEFDVDEAFRVIKKAYREMGIEYNE